MTTTRACPVCRSHTATELFRQQFAHMEGSLTDGYRLCCCDMCGMAFADGVPDEASFARYYAEMSKYESNHRDGETSSTEAERFRQVADLLAPELCQDDSILDVGCATGGLLAEFKRRGFPHVHGLDPSPQCAVAAQRLYGVPVQVGTLKSATGSFSLVSMCGVLEHLLNPERGLREAARLLKDSEFSLVYIEVPDATHYHMHDNAPYQFISVEHVNYFSPQSLDNMMRRGGFVRHFGASVTRNLSQKCVEPVFAALYRFGGSTHEPVLNKDTATFAGLKTYLTQSKSLERVTHRRLAALAKRKVPVAVWGAGTHTLRLLAASPLADCDVVAIVDSNERYRGKAVTVRDGCTRKVLAPESLCAMKANVTVLVSSHVAEQEIRHQIETMGLKNEVVTLYD